MKLVGFLIARNEGDIIGPVLEHLLRLGCHDRIHFFDNRSTDETRRIAERLAGGPLIVSARDEVYSDSLKYRLIAEHSAELDEGDWVHILDADEFLVGNPRALIEAAVQGGCNAIEHGYAQFYLTPDQDGVTFDPRKPFEDQVPHYLINYGEPRLFRYSRAHELTERFVKGRDPRLKVFDRHLLIKHFQFRSRAQIEARLRLRIENNRHSANWGHVLEADWRSYLVPARLLHRFDGQLRYGLPTGTDLFTVRDNTAYTMASLNWMRRNAHLGPAHERFFNASTLERRLRKLNPVAWLR